MYLRKSRAEESEDIGEVLRRHKDTLNEFAATNGLDVLSVYEEVVSGDSLFARPQMLKLLQDVEDDCYEAVLCMDIDRLGRGGMRDQGTILEAFKAHEVQIVTPRKVYDLNNDLDETMTEFQVFMARQELKMIKGRMRRGLQRSVQEGSYVANAPFGYERVTVNKRPSLAPHPSEAEYVRMIFDWYIAGYGCTVIAEKLTDIGVRPHRSAAWNRTTIRRMLSNPVYIGKVVWNRVQFVRPKKPEDIHVRRQNPRDKWIVCDGVHPAIISEEVYNMANKILDGRYHSPYRMPGQIVNPLAGVVFCGVCGRSMQRRPYYGRKYQSVHLLCATKGCVTSSRLEFVEEGVIDAIGLRMLELEEELRLPAAPRANTTAALLQVLKELAIVEQQQNALHDLLEQGVYSIQVYKERHGALTTRKDALVRQREEIEAALVTREQRIEVILPRISHVLQEYWGADAAERNFMLKEIVDKVDYFKDRCDGSRGFRIFLSLKGLRD